jgi:SAM-dependent methyltransferase
MAILDVGSGDSPSVPADRRPAGCRYVGLDISRYALERAPAGSYDSLVVADVAEPLPALVGSFDLILSFQVLEHMTRVDRAVQNMGAYLQPGGRLIVQPLRRVLAVRPRQPARSPLGSQLSAEATAAPGPRDGLSSHYHRCWYSALERMLAQWRSVEITPLWLGAAYLGFARPLQAVYLVYEEWAGLSDRRDVAPYYIVDAVR